MTSAVGGVIQLAPLPNPGVRKEGMKDCYDDTRLNVVGIRAPRAHADQIGNNFCYDQNKVFVLGYSTGSRFVNLLGCVYGSTLVRAMSSNGAGPPLGTALSSPCKANPLPGLWIIPTPGTEGRLEAVTAIDRALTLNKCQGAEGGYSNAPSDPYTDGGAVNCKRYRCPNAVPVVLGEQPAGGEPANWHASAAWAFFNALP